MIEIGRICVKLAGRDAGREAVIVDILDDKYVLIDGNVRRRKCNILHLEPTERKIDIKKDASHEDVKKEFSKLELPVWETEIKAKEKGEKPRKTRGKKKVLEESAEDMKKTKEEKKSEMKRERLKKKEEKRAEEKAAKEKKPIDARVISVTKKKKEKEVSQK